MLIELIDLLTIIDTLHKEGKPHTFIAKKLAVHRVLYQSMLQLCLTFERVSVTLKFPLCSAIVTIVQKSRACGFGYYSYKVLSLVQ